MNFNEFDLFCLVFTEIFRVFLKRKFLTLFKVYTFYIQQMFIERVAAAISLVVRFLKFTSILIGWC